MIVEILTLYKTSFSYSSAHVITMLTSWVEFQMKIVTKGLSNGTFLEFLNKKWFHVLKYISIIGQLICHSTKMHKT